MATGSAYLFKKDDLVSAVSWHFIYAFCSYIHKQHPDAPLVGEASPLLKKHVAATAHYAIYHGDTLQETHELATYPVVTLKDLEKKFKLDTSTAAAFLG